jgi:hypothetical protein
MLDRELASRMTTVPTDFSKGVEAAMAARKTAARRPERKENDEQN